MFGRDAFGLDPVQFHSLSLQDEVLDVLVIHKDKLCEFAQQIKLFALVWDFVV